MSNIVTHPPPPRDPVTQLGETINSMAEVNRTLAEDQKMWFEEYSDAARRLRKYELLVGSLLSAGQTADKAAYDTAYTKLMKFHTQKRD